LRVLLTNDDGWDSPGLLALLEALVPRHAVAVVAPAENQSAVARGITLSRDLDVDEVELPGAEVALAVHGTPVDCVRLAELGAAGPRPDVVLSGANLGVNLGDDVTYSGTVAAAFEALLLGLPAIALSQAGRDGGIGFGGAGFEFAVGARFVARLAEALVDGGGFPAGTLLNVNCPREPVGATLATLGRRLYGDELRLVSEAGRRRTYRIYGNANSYREVAGSDFEALLAGRIAVSPLHFDLDRRDAGEVLGALDLDGLLHASRAATGPGDRPR
jgi:5'-nucleotidase